MVLSMGAVPKELLGMTDREQQVKRIVLTAVEECAVCGQEYELENLDVIGNRGGLWVLTLHCPRCQKQGVIAALVNGDHEAEITAAASDIEDGDEGYPDTREPVRARDVLDMHEFLGRFQGDLTEYLGRRQQEP